MLVQQSKILQNIFLFFAQN